MEEKLGNVLRTYRHRQELSLRRLALKAGACEPYLCQVERGERCPSEAWLVKIAGALDLSDTELDRLIALSGNIPREIIEYVRKEPRALSLFRRIARYRFLDTHLTILQIDVDKICEERV